jgi:hypothetical protein
MSARNVTGCHPGFVFFVIPDLIRNPDPEFPTPRRVRG